MEVKEKLYIKNFLSIKNFDWDIKDFNILTGDMGAGKSLCIKLLTFFENIIPELLLSLQNSDLEEEKFYDRLKNDFTNKFHLQSNTDQINNDFQIEYRFAVKENIFSVIINGKNKESPIEIESPYLNGLIKEWNKKIEQNTKNSPDSIEEYKKITLNDISKQFSNYLPISTIFVPATRAAIANGIDTKYSDPYLIEYKNLLANLKPYKNTQGNDATTILKAKINEEKDDIIRLEIDNRIVPISKASSGQQEILYVLLLLRKLGNFSFTYGKQISVFIEEPSAHLFPQEQKEVIEYIVRTFARLRNDNKLVRFFITTHSPYILNATNNMLEKSALIKKYPLQKEKVEQALSIPVLSIEDLTAFFINNDGTVSSMINSEEGILFSQKIEEIYYQISSDTNVLVDLNNELIRE